MDLTKRQSMWAGFTELRVGKWTIIHNPKPIPDRQFDYDVIHDDYDVDGGDHLLFYCGSIDEAKAGIEERDNG